MERCSGGTDSILKILPFPRPDRWELLPRAELVSILQQPSPLKSREEPLPTHTSLTPFGGRLRLSSPTKEDDDTGVGAGKWPPGRASAPALSWACSLAPGPLHISH